VSKTGQKMRPITTYDPQGRKLEMKNYTRHGAVQFQRHFPEELRVVDGVNGYSVAEYAASERRLVGGNLMESAKRRIGEGRGLTAAAAWCAASRSSTSCASWSRWTVCCQTRAASQPWWLARSRG
jgi:hypothetical protein